MNLRELKSSAKIKLSGTTTDREAETIIFTLVEHRLGLNRTQQLLQDDVVIDTDTVNLLLSDVESVAQGKPVQYITGIGWFMDMPFSVNADVLIPRPETEELVLAARDAISNITAPVILDLCTGSGCIAISLKRLLPQSRVKGVDVSVAALQLAAKNGEKLLSPNAVEWIAGDVLLQSFITGEEDLVISNPPYIPLSEEDTLPQNVREFEPHLALFTPTHDPLLFYRVIGEQFNRHAKSSARLWFECHEIYAEGVILLLQSLGLTEVRLHKDMQQKDRMVQAIKG